MKIGKLDNELIMKVTRMFVAFFCFLCTTYIIGVQMREVHQMFFTLGAMVIFSLFLKNIWFTLFMWWTVFLYTFFKFQLGSVYITNIFMGFVLYYVVKISYKKEHINFFINAVLWLIVVNIVYMCFQLRGYDFVFSGMNIAANGTIGLEENFRPLGFMGNTSYTSILMGMGIPFLMTRSKWWLGLLLFVPIYILNSSLATLSALVVFLFVLFFKIPRKFWIGFVILCIIAGGLYLWKVDMPGTERFCQWKLVMQDAKAHPVTGWGLDSYRNTKNENKPFYGIRGSPTDDGKIHVTQWDNPHNLLVSLFFEWGFLGWIILLGLLRQYGIWFYNSVKEPNTLALAGFLLLVLISSMGHFPLFLARMMVLTIPCAALYEVQTRG